MVTLKFKSVFVNAIKEEIKTSTIRTNFDGKPGDIVDARVLDQGMFGTLEFGQLHIRQVHRIRFDEIDKNIAKTEGYLHEDLLKEVLYDIYDLEDSSLLYYIVFIYIEKEE